jgi:adenylate cyclase
MNRARRSRLHVALFLGVGLAATGIGLVAYGTNVFRELDLQSVDARFSIRGTEAPPDDIVVVKIDDATFDEAERQFEQFRPLHAQVIRRLKADGANVIAYDVQFTEPGPSIEHDNQLIEAVGAAGNVVLATTEVGPNGETAVFGGDDVVREVGARVGNGNFPPDPGGYHRRTRHTIDKLESFAVVTVERATGRDVSDFGTEWIDFHGPVETFEAVSFSDVWKGRTPDGFFRDKIVIVGPWAPTFQDLHPVSSGDDLMPGPEIQANAISTIRRGLPLAEVPAALEILLILGLGLLAPLAGLRFSLRGTLFVSIVTGAAYLVATQLTFQQGRILSFVYPFGTLALSSVGALGAHYLLAAFERERVRDVFSRFVPDAVVEQVLARTDADLRLGGQAMEGTCMFTDVRGFTTFSETLTAAEVIEILNVYLSEMSEAILNHGGTLVAYMGDGIFAVFGAPIEQDDHADRALAAGREMLTERLPRFNALMEERGLPAGFRMGVGLNSGPFMSGNVGHERRLEYTAIGDTTNTAARLEGMTKGQPYVLFMSDTTKQALTRPVDDLVFVDEFEVRGRQSAVKIWSVEAASAEALAARTTGVDAASGDGDTALPVDAVHRNP